MWKAVLFLGLLMVWWGISTVVGESGETTSGRVAISLLLTVVGGGLAYYAYAYEIRDGATNVIKRGREQGQTAQRSPSETGRAGSWLSVVRDRLFSSTWGWVLLVGALIYILGAQPHIEWRDQQVICGPGLEYLPRQAGDEIPCYGLRQNTRQTATRTSPAHRHLALYLVNLNVRLFDIAQDGEKLAIRGFGFGSQ